MGDQAAGNGGFEYFLRGRESEDIRVHRLVRQKRAGLVATPVQTVELLEHPSSPNLETLRPLRQSQVHLSLQIPIHPPPADLLHPVPDLNPTAVPQPQPTRPSLHPLEISTLQHHLPHQLPVRGQHQHHPQQFGTGHWVHAATE